MKKRIVLMLIMVCTIICTVACASKNIKLTSISKEELIGTWSMNDDTHKATFNEDGTCSIYALQTDGEYSECTYELNDNQTITLTILKYWKGKLNDDNSLTIGLNGFDCLFVKTDAALALTGEWQQAKNADTTFKIHDDSTLEFYNKGELCGTSGVKYTYTYDDSTKEFNINGIVTMDLGLNGDKLRFNNVDFTKE